MDKSTPATQSGEVRALSHLPIGTPEGRIDFGMPMKNNTKMAVLIRNIFGTPAFERAHYIGLVMEGPLAGGTIIRAPGAVQIICGEKPVSKSGGGSGSGGSKESNGISFFTHAENGDIVLSAPKGRIRIQAQDIDLVTTGTKAGNGWISLAASGTCKIKANRVEAEGADAVKFGTERKYSIDVPGTYEINCGRLKVVEGAESSPISVQSGTSTPTKFIESLTKLVKDTLG